MLYYNKDKAPEWLRAVGLQLPEANTIKRLNPTVKTDENIVKSGVALLSRSRDNLRPSATPLSERDVQAEIDHILATFKAHQSVSVEPISSLDSLSVKDQQDVADQGGTESNTKGVGHHCC